MKSGKRPLRTCFVRYRVTAEEFAELAARASRQGLTLSEFARAATLCAEVSLAHKLPPTEISAGDRLIADQIRRVGVNMNQIAHIQNMLKIPAPPELHPLLLDMRRYVDLVWARHEP